MGVWQEYQNNPCGRKVGDCAVRAVSIALDIDWKSAYCLLAARGYEVCDVMNADAVIGSLLKSYGFERGTIPTACPDCYSAEDFCMDHPKGTYMLFFGGHVATVKSGKLMDSWDSSKESPQYYWAKE